MLIGKLDVGHVFCSSGARGFFDEGYWWHHYLKNLGLDWTGSTFVAKTVTTDEREGNMPLALDRITPRDRRPKCIYVTPRSWLMGGAVNAVGLSNAGAEYLLGLNRWQKRTNPFFLSFMAVGDTPAKRLEETKRFIDLLFREKHNFSTDFGLKLNRSCPNTGHNLIELADETASMVEIAKQIDIDVAVKISAEEAYSMGITLQQMGCDGIFVSNTFRWDSIPEYVRQRVFGRTDSPLADLGGGGISGSPLLKYVVTWIKEARKLGVTIPIIGGGGILSIRDALKVIDAGADGVSLGSIAFLRPWRIHKIICEVNYHFWGQGIRQTKEATREVARL